MKDEKNCDAGNSSLHINYDDGIIRKCGMIVSTIFIKMIDFM